MFDHPTEAGEGGASQFVYTAFMDPTHPARTHDKLNPQVERPENLEMIDRLIDQIPMVYD